MVVRTLNCCAVLLAVTTLLAGCSLLGSGDPDSRAERGDYRVVDRSDQCRWNRSSCIYEGAYESGERSYAEQEAKRLNQASIDRLRRSAR